MNVQVLYVFPCICLLLKGLEMAKKRNKVKRQYQSLFTGAPANACLRRSGR
jgi:hypothetical protein